MKYAIIYVSLDRLRGYLNGYPSTVYIKGCPGHFEIKNVNFEPIRMAFCFVIESDALPMIAPGSNIPELEVLYSRS